MAGKAADASRESPIRPQTGEVENLGHAPEASVLLPMAVTPHGTTEAPTGMATGEADSGEDEENDARLPKTKKVPVGMTATEWSSHKLTHLPYNPACRC